MNSVRRLLLFSSQIERDAALADIDADELTTGVTGVGLVRAAIGTARVMERYNPSEIVYLGTCGAYSTSNINPGSIVSAGAVAIGSGDVISGLMRIPSLAGSALQCDASVARSFEESVTQSADVMCTLGVTENSELGQLLGTEAQVENLELYSVLSAAGDTPVAALLGVTNWVGPEGGRDWKSNYGEMMARLGAIVSPPQ